MRDAASRTAVLLMAHGTPESVDQMADYLRLVRGGREPSAELIEEMTHNSEAGRTPEPWLGPDLSEHVRQRAKSGVRSMLVVPVGFVCDHTEILFDVDVQAAAAALEAGVTLRRTQSWNTSPTFIRALAELVRQSSVGSRQSVVVSRRSQSADDCRVMTETADCRLPTDD